MSVSTPTDISVRSPEASIVIVHHVPPERAGLFVHWQEELTAFAQQAPGYVNTEVYPPAEQQSDQWVVVATFADQDSLNEWLNSPARIDFIEKMRDEVGSFSVEKMPAGFGAWFAGQAKAPVDQLPGWKMVLVVLLALYPTVMLLTLYVSPLLSRLGITVTILIGNFLGVCALQWLLMPPLTRAMRRWLSTPLAKAPLLNIGGAVGIVALLGCMAAAFHRLAD